jgi:hypothetical protein
VPARYHVIPEQVEECPEALAFPDGFVEPLKSVMQQRLLITIINEYAYG